MPLLMHSGGQGLNPVKKYPEREKGIPLIPIDEITRFFLSEMGKKEPPLPDHYLESLTTLFKVMVHELPPIAFDCGYSISQEDIQEADNKKTIEFLCTNIIITYFNMVNNIPGNQDNRLTNPDLKAVIQNSTAGRDYKRLVSNTLKGLIFSLAQDKPWVEYVEDINDADLICRLAGARLPSMEKGTLSSILNKAQQEITGLTDLFSKLLYTRAQTVSSQNTSKEFFKSMEKLDTAIYALLQKIDNYLNSAYRLREILELAPKAIIGDAFSKLKQDLLWIFFEVWPKGLEQKQIPSQAAVSAMRYRMNILFSFPHITRFCREIRNDPAYEAPFTDLFRLMFKELAEKIHRIYDKGDTQLHATLEIVERALIETQRAIDNFGLDESWLPDEKQEVKIAFIALILNTGYDAMEEVTPLCEILCRVTQDRDREIMVSMRAALMEKAFITLEDYADKKQPIQTVIPEITKRLSAHAVHFRPQRDFYRIFFDTYIISTPRPQTPHITRFMINNRPFAKALLMVFSDDKAMNELLPEPYIERAEQMLADLIKAESPE